MDNNTKIFCDFEKFANFMPIPVYWANVDCVLLGGNELAFKGISETIPKEQLVNKTAYDYYPANIADEMTKKTKKVIQEKKALESEEQLIDKKTGKTKYFLVTRAPLFDDKGVEVVGTICTAMEITDRKEKERLQIETEQQKLETQLQQTKIAEQEVFRNDVGQLVHDVSTPIGTIQIILEDIQSLVPESERLILKNAVGSIKGMTGNLLGKYKKDKDEDKGSEPTLISLLLAQVLEEKKIQSANTSIEFSDNFGDYNFSFININQLAIKRSVTNLLNNAVEAIDKKGTIELDLGKKANFITITIKDNGKGMPQEVLDKLKNHIAVTSGKKNGHGIGFTQIHETVKDNHGTVDIESIPNQGTTITLAFPEIAPPSWLVTELHFNPNDTVVVLDDDNSIHGAWDIIFKKYQDVISVKHFTQGSEAITFINSLSNKNQIFLLADFELLKQDLNGIDVIKQTNVRSVLVTSHYTDKTVLRLVQDNNIKLLPKQLAAEVVVTIAER